MSLALRTDAIGIFAVLCASGLAQIPRPPGSILAQMPLALAYLWVASLVGFGALGLVATLLPRRARILGMGLEVAARLGLGCASLVYGIGIWVSFGFRSSGFIIVTYCGIAFMMFVGAYRLAVWLREQRRVVNEVLALQQESRDAP